MTHKRRGSGLAERILDHLSKSKRNYTQTSKLADSLNTEEKKLANALDALEREGEVIRASKDRIALASRLGLITGRVNVGRGGRVVVIPDIADAPIAISAARVRPAMHRDRVLVEVEPFRRGARGLRPGRIKSVLERGSKTIVGVYGKTGGPHLVPVDDRTGYVIVVHDPPASARVGETVSARILEYPSNRGDLVVAIEESLGRAGLLVTEIRAVCASLGIPETFPSEAEQEAAAFEEPGDRLTEGRRDLRDELTFTIDGSDAKDFDDAVSIATRAGGGWRLTISIADVSHYVQQGGPLDDAAFERATSTYFPGRAVPMLPEVLSNGLASLRPGVNRLAVSAILDVDKKGNVIATAFTHSLIRSNARLTYEQVESALGGNSVPGVTPEILTALQEMNVCAGHIGERRHARGSLDLDVGEAQVVLDNEGQPERILRRTRLASHRLIEEFMVAANEAVARHLEHENVAFLYRIHERPDEEALDALVPRLRALGIRLDREGESLEPRGIQALLEDPATEKAPQQVNILILRSLARARYSPYKEIHFGLASAAYCHFTSPIRRYPDLVVHRALTAALAGEKAALPPAGRLETVAEHCSSMERRSTEAERDIDRAAAIIYMQDKIGDVYDGTVSGAERFGYFVQLDDPYVEGMVPLARLTGYYEYDQDQMKLEDRTTGEIIKIGDKVRVRVAAAELSARMLDFLPVSDHPPGSRPRKTARPTPGHTAPKARGGKRAAKSYLGKSGKKGSSRHKRK